MKTNLFFDTQYWTIRYRLRRFLGNWPLTYYSLMTFRPDKQHLLINDETDIVIEGYPRSGNTFATAALLISQPTPVNIARHTHLPAQVIQAVHLDLPTIILIRNPVDAAVSHCIRNKFLTPKLALSEYINFYERVKAFQGRFVLAPFDEVVNDFGSIIRKVNQKFNRQFREFNNTPDNMELCFRLIEQMDMEDTGKGTIDLSTVARPNAERDQQKDLVRNNFKDPKFSYLREKAEYTYQLLLSNYR